MNKQQTFEIFELGYRVIRSAGCLETFHTGNTLKLQRSAISLWHIEIVVVGGEKKKPSRQDSPTPMWAFCIIATSLAPSPIASVTAFVLLVTRSTTYNQSLSFFKNKKQKNTHNFTSAFCIGETRQHITTLHEVHKSRKSRLRSHVSAYFKLFPSITRPTSFWLRKSWPKSTQCWLITSLVF